MEANIIPNTIFIALWFMALTILTLIEHYTHSLTAGILMSIPFAVIWGAWIIAITKELRAQKQNKCFVN
jgi:hypothetical protein